MDAEVGRLKRRSVKVLKGEKIMSRRFVALFLSIIMIFVCADPMFALNVSVTKEELTEAYIDFSIRMFIPLKNILML